MNKTITQELLFEAKKKLDAMPLHLTEEQKERVWLYDIINNALKKAYYKGLRNGNY